MATSSLDYFGSTLFAGVAILGTHFRTILGTGLFSGLVIFLVFRGDFCSFVLTDTTSSLIFFTSFFGSSFFFSPSFFLCSSLTTR
jgi:hypothetical protein